MLTSGLQLHWLPQTFYHDWVLLSFFLAKASSLISFPSTLLGFFPQESWDNNKPIFLTLHEVCLHFIAGQLVIMYNICVQWGVHLGCTALLFHLINYRSYCKNAWTFKRGKLWKGSIHYRLNMHIFDSLTHFCRLWRF